MEEDTQIAWLLFMQELHLQDVQLVFYLDLFRLFFSFIIFLISFILFLYSLYYISYDFNFIVRSPEV